jgi:nicotinamidase-related amidase
MALMVIDLQKAYRNQRNGEAMDQACEYINAVLPLFRKAGLPVVWVQNREADEGVVPGSEGFEFVDALRPEEGEPRIVKDYGNSFNKTGLAEIMRGRAIDTVLLTGYCAEHCVLSTYRGAQDLDLTPVLLKNAIASDERENALFVEKISNIMSYQVLRRMLGS